MYTARFSECWEHAGAILVDDHSTVQDLSARIDVGGYTRIAIIILSESGSGNTIDVDIEQANALTGGTLKTLTSNGKDVAIADTDSENVIEIRTEEFDTNGGFNYLNVEATPSAARMFGVLVLGMVKGRPASTTNWAAVTD